MNDYWKGVLGGVLAVLVSVIIGLAAGKAFGQVDELMRDKVPLFAGECSVDVNNLMTKDASKRVKTYFCTVGKDLSEPDDVLWFVFSDERGVFQIIRFDDGNETQEIKWRRGQLGA